MPWPTVLVKGDDILWSNVAFASAIGVPWEELPGTSMRDLVFAEDHARLQQALAEVCDRPARTRLHMRGADGARRAFDVLVGAGSEEGTRWLGLTDVTDAEGAEDIIASLAGLSTSGDGKAMMDRDGFLQAGHTFFASLGWTVAIFAVHGDEVELERVLGKLTDDAPGRFLHSLIGRRLALEQIPDMAQCVRTRRGSFVDAAADRAASASRRYGWDEDGSREIAAAMNRLGLDRRVCAPVIAGDRPRHVVLGMGPSLTERDFAAIQLFAAQLAACEVLRDISEDMARQQRLAGLGQLSTMVAHEVRNPLAVIFQAGRQLRRRLEGHASAGELLDILDEEAGRLKRLVDDLVEFAGPTRPRLQAVDLSEVVRWCLMGLQEGDETPEGRAELTLRIAEEATLVHADPLLLRQALTHLLTHAFERAGATGSVLLFAERVDGRVHVRVCDDGPEIADGTHDVFEPFLSTGASGSGLGLAVVRRLVEDLQGTVTFDPKHPDGCAFTLDLGAAEPVPT
jgi:signal transduction histidine kinase